MDFADLYLDLQGYQQFVQRLPLDVAISGEFQESHYWGTVVLQAWFQAS